MTETPEECVLRLLAEHEALYGRDLCKHSDGVLKRGTMFVVLARMEDRGLVQKMKVYMLDTPPQLLFSLTADGKRAAGVKTPKRKGKLVTIGTRKPGDTHAERVQRFADVALPVSKPDRRWEGFAAEFEKDDEEDDDAT